MKKTIWKFELQLASLTMIKIPKDAEILSIQSQRDEVCLWALVDPKSETEERFFEVIGTGHPIKYDMGVERKYLGTCQMDEGLLALHIFERIN